MSVEDLLEGGDMSTIEVLDVSEVIGSLGRDAVDPNAETVLMKRNEDQLTVLAEQLDALFEEEDSSPRPVAPVV